jgi:hypothetical protein
VMFTEWKILFLVRIFQSPSEIIQESRPLTGRSSPTARSERFFFSCLIIITFPFLGFHFLKLPFSLISLWNFSNRR